MRGVIFTAFFEVVDVLGREFALVEHGHVGVFWGLGAAANGVAFPGIIDALGKAPFGEKAGPVEAPIERLLVEIDFAAGHGVIAGRLQALVVGLLVEGEIVLIAGDAAVFVFAAGGQAGAAGGAEGGGAQDFVEAHAARGEGLDVGELNGNLRVAGQPIGTPLIGEEEQKVGLLGLRLQCEGCGGGEETAAGGHGVRLLDLQESNADSVLRYWDGWRMMGAIPPGKFRKGRWEVS